MKTAFSKISLTFFNVFVICDPTHFLKVHLSSSIPGVISVYFSTSIFQVQPAHKL